MNRSSGDSAAATAAQAAGFLQDGVKSGTPAANMMAAGQGKTPAAVAQCQSAGARGACSPNASATAVAHAVGYGTTGVKSGSPAADMMAAGKGTTPTVVSQCQSLGAKGHAPAPGKN